jgi:ketosteroid isomerase-like protein
MLSWLSHRVIAYVMGQTRRGNIRPTLLLDAPEVTLTFPGDNSWSGTFRGRDAVERWLRRLTEVGLQTHPDEVVASGFPWRMTVCVRGHDDLRAPSGELVYENRFVIWGHMKWGRLTDYEVYEDTIKSRALDAYLQRERPDLADVHPLSGASGTG